MDIAKIGLQLWTFRHDLRHNPDLVLAKISRLGVSAVELAGTADKDPKEFAGLLKKHNLHAIGAHYGALRDQDLDDIRETMILHAKCLGCTLAVIPFPPEFEKGNLSSKELKSKYVAYASLCDQTGAMLRKEGVALCFHPYDFDLRPIDPADSELNISGLEILLSGSEPANLGVELDTYFIHCARQSLSDLISRCTGRVSFVHVNDCCPNGGQVSLGRGTVDWVETFACLNAAPNKLFPILEHDSTDPLTMIENSLKYLTDFTTA